MTLLSPPRSWCQTNPRVTVTRLAVLPLITALSTLISCSSRELGDELPAVVRESALDTNQVVQLVTDRDLDPEMVSYVATQHSIAHPSWISADLDADGRGDYALLAMTSFENQCEVALVLVLQPARARPAALPVARLGSPCARTGAGTYRVDIYLRQVQAGAQVEETDAALAANPVPPVALAADGVEVNYFERGAQVFFLDGGQLRAIWTAD